MDTSNQSTNAIYGVSNILNNSPQSWITRALKPNEPANNSLASFGENDKDLLRTEVLLERLAMSAKTTLKLRMIWTWIVVVTVISVFTANSNKIVSSSAQASKPNIVLIISDDQNVDSLPVMRKLMSYPQGSWVRFKNAFVSNSICCPSRATILTGQYSFHTGVVSNGSGNNFDDTNTLAVWLDQAGYRTGLFGKYLNGYPWNRGTGYIPPGWDHFQTRGFGGTPDGMTSAAINFINNSTGPFFVHLGYWDPHQPAKVLDRYANTNVYVPPDPKNFNEASVGDKPLYIRQISPLSQSTIDALHNERIASQRALLGVDDGIQNIVNALRAKGVLENTMIIFLGDNGVAWGSHRLWRKACVYEECIRTPLFIRYPGLGQNRVERRLVSNVDLTATIAAYAGITPGLPQDGHSLIPVITNTTTNWREEVFLEVHSWTPKMTFDGIRVPGWTYAEYANGDKELYDLGVDPYQLHNKAYDPAYRTMRNSLAQRLYAIDGMAYASQADIEPGDQNNEPAEPTLPPVETEVNLGVCTDTASGEILPTISSPEAMWQAATDDDWLYVTGSGAGSSPVQVIASCEGMPGGEHSGQVYITGTGGQLEIVTVWIRVSEDGSGGSGYSIFLPDLISR